MAQADNFNFRVNDDLKNKFIDLCRNNGITMTKAIVFYARKCIDEQKLPFSLTENFNSVQNYMANTNACIRMDVEIKKKFQEFCDSFGIAMANLVKMYMIKCVSEGRLLFI